VTRVKLCGVTTAADVELCVEAGADAIGFVVRYPEPVPWNLEPRQARELVARVPPFSATVAVVGGDARAILELVEQVAPNAVQLHRDEDAATVAAVAAGLAGTGVKVIKAVRIATDAGAVPPAEHWLGLARAFVDAGADAILLDSKTTLRPAGTGQAFDWQIARTVVAELGAPVLLAGGLTPENVAGAVADVRPYAVDVISSVEDHQHRKAPERVRAFVRAARQGSEPR
jgi:phosphoribosylanthranilate isomerase